LAPFSLVGADSLPRNVPNTHTSALKGTLQDMIHGFYLKAIARMPAGELRSRFHRSLLVAGHCYGPPASTAAWSLLVTAMARSILSPTSSSTPSGMMQRAI
jgi:hypothetical protein